MVLRVYEKPELIDLNEQPGYGSCENGSGDPGCNNGNAAGTVCFDGAGGIPTGTNCLAGGAANYHCDSGSSGYDF